MAIRKEDYLYLSSLLRAREARLVTREKAERMIDQPSFEESAKMLVENGYEDMSRMSLKQIEDGLARRRASIFREMEGLVPDAAVLDLFRLKYDYHNVKVMIKSEGMQSDNSELLSESGRVSVTTMKKCFQDDRLQDLPGQLGTIADQARLLLSRSGNPQLSDFLLDRALFAELSELTKKIGGEFAAAYIALLADSNNLRSAVRILRMGKDAGYLREALVPGGSISEERVMIGISGEGIAALYALTPLKKAAQLGADVANGGKMTVFELACDNALASFIADAKRFSFGEECVIAYLAGIESELTAVRMILSGKLVGIPGETIRERLRDLYA